MICTLATVMMLGFVSPENSQPVEPKELLPGIRVADGLVEFDGSVAIDAHHPDTPDVYLEMFITAPDSREHESRVVSKIRASNLHAGLLAAGLEPGSPITRNDAHETVPAHGDPVKIFIKIDDESS